MAKTRKMLKSTQVRNIKRLLGSKSDLIDVNALVDGRLSYAENKRIVLAKAARRGIRLKSSKSFKGDPIYYVDKAKKLHNKRKLLSRAMDGMRVAKKTFRGKLLSRDQFVKWRKNMDRYDIDVVDGRGTYQKVKKFRKLTAKQVDKVIDDIL